MTEALERARPRIDHPDELARLVDRIVREIAPVAVYLFGSRARGDAVEDSDYDLMVVVRDGRDTSAMKTKLETFHLRYKNASTFLTEVRAMNRLANNVMRESYALWADEEWRDVSSYYGPVAVDCECFLGKADFHLSTDRRSPHYGEALAEAAEYVIRAEATAARTHVDQRTVRRAAAAARQQLHDISEDDLKTRIERLRERAAGTG